jgi:transcriptional regulator with XRE-family HTH domain
LTKPLEFTESHTDLGIAGELNNREFRNQFFRTERELDIPAQLKALRKLRGLNQGELAEMIGTKQSGISRLERSSHGNWNLETLVKIAEALDARLAVVIEPFEAVVARYIVEEKSAKKSAATADDVGFSPPPPSIFPPPSKILKEDSKRSPYGQDRRGATWN